MANKTMRIKDVGATINLGNYSSLHVTIGEESEFAGLDIGKAQDYLTKIAEMVGGTLNLPSRSSSKKATPKQPVPDKGQLNLAYGSNEKIYYNNDSHSYSDIKGNSYISVTQLVEKFYPFEAKGTLAQEYLDFASAYGNMIHTAIQNTVVGKAPAKKMVNSVTKDVIDAMTKIAGAINNPVVERILAFPEFNIAGRFDILTENASSEKILWDVKTNTNLSASCKCLLPKSVQDRLSQYWSCTTIFGQHCLQLNIYAHILEKHCRIPIKNIYIIHAPDGYQRILSVPKVDISDIINGAKETD